MRAAITISLPREVETKLKTVSTMQHLNRSQLVQLAINEYLTKFEFYKIRQQLLPKARRRGFYTDEDIFAQVS